MVYLAVQLKPSSMMRRDAFGGVGARHLVIGFLQRMVVGTLATVWIANCCCSISRDGLLTNW